MRDEVVPTPREMEILKVLWELGEATVRDVYRKLRAHEEVAYNTVQTMLRIMAGKGLVRHRVHRRAFVYQPLYTRQHSLQRFVERVFDGAAEELVLTLIQSQPLSPRALERLRQLIEETRRKRSRGEERTA
ncbi:MAG: CopY family transcriptional regulator [Gemmataceae bacterium]